MYTVMTQEITRQKVAELQRQADAYRLSRAGGRGREPVGEPRWMPKSLGRRLVARLAALL